MNTTELLACVQTRLPSQIIDNILQECRDFPNDLKPAKTIGVKSQAQRKTLIKGISTYEWFAGMLWHYITRANNENFLFDITCFENEGISYLCYPTNHYYHWHQDSTITTCLKPIVIPSLENNTGHQSIMIEGQYIRKLSFSLQLSDSNDYTGGDLQFHHNNYAKTGVLTAPRDKGSLIIFDSRLSHRVKKVTSGQRESLVGWVVGPRWK